ncbi:four helix bundle protein [Tenuifilum thalassicum]|uniref:Four helix bundle protein n=1 Tax=Tenuifilum thalassicum TaxID=2590900 RepID=A0A7D4AXT5_9BACT|nr:four helix bundle protein [Tenuifilum thalassicum]QKG80394.1 four helix bundle protein [Tenuifilum thalassicum]
MLDFKEMNIWHKGRELAKEIYLITKSFPNEELFGLTLQIRKSAISVISNISEGFGRANPKETIQFLNISKGSLFELEAKLTISYDLNYIDEKTFGKISNLILECIKLVQGSSNYFKKKLKNI